MSPKVAYSRLNRLLWMGRLPNATVSFVDNETIPCLHGITMNDGIDFQRPVILLNQTSSCWGETLVHECLHVAEPTLRHGDIFDALVTRYWRKARKEIKGWHTKSKSLGGSKC